MDFGIFASKRPSARRLRPSLFIALFGVTSAAVALGFLSLRMTRETKPIPVSLPVATPAVATASLRVAVKESDETILVRQVLQEQCHVEGLVYVGIESEDGILVDLDPSLMQSLTAADPPPCNSFPA